MFSGSQHDYIVVQKHPPEIRGPYLHLQLAMDELIKVAENYKEHQNTVSAALWQLPATFEKGTFECQGEILPDQLDQTTINYGDSRMIIEAIDGVNQDSYSGVHVINGQIQKPSNGFEKFWWGWPDIQDMIEICRQRYFYYSIGNLCCEYALIEKNVQKKPTS